jgi:hypothetical protein
MAFITPTRQGRFEVRETRSTERGPRSRTLATFRELTDEVIEKARARADKPPSREELVGAARRVGAPVAPAPVNRAARDLIAELATGEEPEPRLRHLLVEAVRDGWAGPTPRPDTARSAAEWIAATPTKRGKTLVDLLLLADALPHSGRRGKPLRFPRLESKGT